MVSLQSRAIATSHRFGMARESLARAQPIKMREFSKLASSRALLALVRWATIRTTVTLGDEFEEGEISFILSLQRKTSCLTPLHFDHARAAAFEERLVGALNCGAICLMTSLGHRTGLFDVMADMPSAGSEAIAARRGLNERYVREWLGAIVSLSDHPGTVFRDAPLL
jgi:hypothetical protein